MYLGDLWERLGEERGNQFFYYVSKARWPQSWRSVAENKKVAEFDGFWPDISRSSLHGVKTKPTTLEGTILFVHCHSPHLPGAFQKPSVRTIFGKYLTTELPSQRSLD